MSEKLTKIQEACKAASERTGKQFVFQDDVLFIGTDATPLSDECIEYLKGSDEGTHGEASCVPVTEKEALEYLEKYGK